jgi:hypothetical protein
MMSGKLSTYWRIIVVKTSATLLVSLCCAGLAFGQQQAAAPVKMECRDLSTSGNVVFSNETLVNGMACHVVDAKPRAQVNIAPPTNSATQNLTEGQPAAESLPSVTAAPVTTAPVTAPPATTAPVLANAHIIPGATVYIEAMDGFDNYLAAALRKKSVPLVPVANKEQATYILSGTSEEKKPGWAKIAFTGQIHSDNEASVRMIDRASGIVVFAYAVDKKNTLHGQQTTAEACAKHLKEQIEKGK